MCSVRLGAIGSIRTPMKNYQKVSGNELRINHMTIEWFSINREQTETADIECYTTEENGSDRLDTDH